ncbi:putative signal transducing protein [Marinigracilibium pacificum]|uniref:DUF2007 domain-containing protein n=1 Tax=Marinigracilibium pacificum TaxID=2729599 RepID=A0A848J6R6_9BACT|nr:DUF2007 domain-containing protein [Marinigracilibium pacificum]NMM50210.1 DUF2007 domain-containing protein [Marinigracilibium pacificum]
MGLVLLLREYDYSNAHIMRSKLQRHGVPVILIDEETSVTLPHLKTLIGGIGLMVLEDDYEMARNILGLEHKEPTPIIACPHCNSINAFPVEEKSFHQVLNRIINIFSPENIATSKKDKYLCHNCGNTFNN